MTETTITALLSTASSTAGVVGQWATIWREAASAQRSDMMTNHAEAMEMLRSAIFYDVIGRLEPCRRFLKRRTMCWSIYYVEIDGRFMRRQLKSVDCGANEGMAECMRLLLAVPSDPLGITKEAADELGAYAGPLQQPILWYPR